MGTLLLVGYILIALACWPAASRAVLDAMLGSHPPIGPDKPMACLLGALVVAIWPAMLVVLLVSDWFFPRYVDGDR